MRIAQIAPLYETVPPRTYGGTERVVSYLTEELVEQGHDVTLFAAEGSITAARLRLFQPHRLRKERLRATVEAQYSQMLKLVEMYATSFDVMHFHIDRRLHFPLVRRQVTPHVTSLHGPGEPELDPFPREFCAMPAVSVEYGSRTVRIQT